MESSLVRDTGSRHKHNDSLSEKECSVHLQMSSRYVLLQEQVVLFSSEACKNCLQFLSIFFFPSASLLIKKQLGGGVRKYINPMLFFFSIPL